MRFVFALLGAVLLAQCASKPEERDDGFRVGQSDRAFVIIGVAESSSNTSATYDMLWRRLDQNGNFTPEVDGGRTAFQAETNERGTIRIRGIPGEFMMREIAPGTYALDSVFATIRDERVNYIANGVVGGPDRPAFDVAPGEAIYLGIWETNIEDVTAVARPWRLNAADLRAVVDRQDRVAGEVRLRETYTRAVPCTPQRYNNRSQRQIC